MRNLKSFKEYFTGQINANKEYDLKDKALYYKLVRQAMSVMPGSQKQKQIKKEIERVQKRLGIKEDAKRIPRKPGQKAGSDKHSDLYTDENPKGTIHGLGFTDAEKARQSVNKIKNSGKTHAHKIQAAIAMSQRAKVASERAKEGGCLYFKEQSSSGRTVEVSESQEAPSSSHSPAKVFKSQNAPDESHGGEMLK